MMDDPNGKIIPDWESQASLSRLPTLQHRRGALVFACGCFDICHAGMAATLNWAKRRDWLFEPFLVVGLCHDATVKRLKGADRPRVPFMHRAYLLASLAAVDLVVGYSQDTAEKLVSVLRPDVLLKGGQYKLDEIPEANKAVALGGVVVLAPETVGISTSAILANSVKV